MRQNVITLERFYASSLGMAAHGMAQRRLASLWPDLSGHDVLGFGFAGPYLLPYQNDVHRIILAMPGEQGALATAGRRGIISCLVEEDLLPFTDGQFDNVLCVHAVEETPQLDVLLRELWRVTRPEGRIVVIASNRSGLWARSEKSPFGAGRPYSRVQLRAALNRAGFVPTVWSGAVYMPPLRFMASPGLTKSCERFGETVWPRFSGLVLVEAIKRLYARPKGTPARLVLRPAIGGTAITNRNLGPMKDSYEPRG